MFCAATSARICDSAMSRSGWWRRTLGSARQPRNRGASEILAGRRVTVAGASRGDGHVVLLYVATPARREAPTPAAARARARTRTVTQP